MNAVTGYLSPAPTPHPDTVAEAARTFRSRAGSTAFTGRIVAQVGAFADPYASPFEQYFVTTDEEPGEVFDFGRPLRDCRFFPNKAQEERQATRPISCLRARRGYLRVEILEHRPAQSQGGRWST